jgi:PAS domain S-box-containing protein
MSLGASDFINKNHVEEGGLRRVLGYNLANKKNDNALSISMAGFKAIGEASPMGIMVSDILGNITYTNSAYHEITGCNAEQLQGQNWAESVHPQDKLRIQSEWRQAMQLQKTFHSQVRLKRRDNSISEVLIHGSFLRDQQNLYGHVRLFEDITGYSHAKQQEGLPRLFFSDDNFLPVDAV